MKFPGGGTPLPIMDNNDLSLVGWGAAVLDDGRIMIGVDDTPYAIVIEPGKDKGIFWNENGVLHMDGVCFLGPMRPGANPEGNSVG